MCSRGSSCCSLPVFASLRFKLVAGLPKWVTRSEGRATYTTFTKCSAPARAMHRRSQASWGAIDSFTLVVAFLLVLLTAHEVRQRSIGYGRGRRPDINAAQTQEFSADGDEAVQLSSQQCAARDRSHVRYEGETLGPELRMPTADACCQACVDYVGCNAWSWCGNSECSGGHVLTDCLLRRTNIRTVTALDPFSRARSGWTSGSAHSPTAKIDHLAAEKQRLEVLRFNSDLPLVYMDISIKGWPAGRIEMVLFKDAAPLAAENFRALCTGEKGLVPKGHKGAGKPYSFKGSSFYLMVDQIMNVAGAGTDSIYGGAFKDEPGGLALKHDRKGLLTMVNDGEDLNTSDFAITLVPSPNLDGTMVVFGEVVAGMEVVVKINAVARGKPNDTAGVEEQVLITDSGELFRHHR